MSSITPNIAPKFQVILASAHLSKKKAQFYISDFVKRAREKEKEENFKRAAHRFERKAGDPEELTFPKLEFRLPIEVRARVISNPMKEQKLQGDVNKSEFTGSETGSETGLEKEPYKIVGAVDAGEDSLFHSLNGNNVIFGVADGVGGWNESGIDPSVFSRSLTSYCAQVAKSMWQLHLSDNVDPSQTLSKAYSWMRHDKLELYGSSTCLLGSYNMLTGQLLMSQLGDSTFAIFNRTTRQLRFVAGEQQHRFNMPYQLTGKIPDERNFVPPSIDYCYIPTTPMPEDLSDNFKDLAYSRLDSPKDAIAYKNQLNHNELVLLATDGLFDNVNTDTIQSLLSTSFSSPNSIENVKTVMRLLVETAVVSYLDKDSDTPFSIRAKQSGYTFKGGKPDDVTLLMVFAQNSANSPSSKL